MEDQSAVTVLDIIGRGADDAIAVRAPGRQPMTYRDLNKHAAGVAARLRGQGASSGDRIAILLPNGPEMAVSFLATALCCVAAPLNPAYRREELDFYLQDLDPRLLILSADETGPAVDAAWARGISLVRVSCGKPGKAGLLLSAELDAADVRATDIPIDPDRIALALHTSGTTSRPKMVPLSHRNLAASARHIATSLALGPDDACLNIMPLFHIHGLVGALLSSLYAGATAICTPGFNALRFMAWLKSEAPTWYTAVPTMHQAIAERAGRQPEEARASGLRFIRSSSAPLAPSTLKTLEGLFDCTMVEAYGMTEAAHQMTSNPLGRAMRKPGSVGIPAGPEVRVADRNGAFEAVDVEGEIVIRGPNVMRAYHANADANAAAFFENGGIQWFRTGDLGKFDSDGFLTVTGRIREIINRGGEKIAPREVDEVLLTADGVAQAVTFAYPHAKLGEDVAAAVVIVPGSEATPADIRAHAAARLAAFKVPRKILIVDDIPKGPTGKIQRIGLASLLSAQLAKS